MSTDDELPSVEDIYDNHVLIEEEYNIQHTGVRAYFPDQKIEGVIGEAREYDDEFEQAAVLLRELPNRHVFEDGNKRTAWVTVVEYLDRLNLEPAKTGEEVEKVMKARQRFNIEELAKWLESGEIDRSKVR